MEPIAWLDRLAGGQRGLVERWQLREHGTSPATTSRWLASGRLVVVQPCVYRVAGAPVTWEQRLLAGVMTGGEGAVASHRSAARLWDVLDTDMVEITVTPERRCRPRVVTVHRSGDVAGARVVLRHGIPTTTPLRLFVDLGAVVPPGVLEDALDRALGRQLVSVDGVSVALGAVARRGRTGAGVLRRLLDERALGAQRPDSLLEPRMARLLRASGLPEAVFQHEVRHDGRFVARIDFAYPAFRLAVEVDGFERHSSPQALQGDLRRQNRSWRSAGPCSASPGPTSSAGPTGLRPRSTAFCGHCNSHSEFDRAENGRAVPETGKKVLYSDFGLPYFRRKILTAAGTGTGGCSTRYARVLNASSNPRAPLALRPRPRSAP